LWFDDFLAPLLETRKCVKCGVENVPFSMFCHKCGTPLTLLMMSDEDLKDYIMKYVREAK